MLLSQCHKLVETLKMPVIPLRLKPRPDYVGIPQAPSPEGHHGPRDSTAAMNVQSEELQGDCGSRRPMLRGGGDGGSG